MKRPYLAGLLLCAGFAPAVHCAAAPNVIHVTAVPRPDITRYLLPLRNHHANLQAIKNEIAAIPTNPICRSQHEAQQWVDRVRTAGQRASGEGQAFARTLGRFLAGETRGGLDEELDLAKSNLALFADIVDGYQKLTNLSSSDYEVTLQQTILYLARDYFLAELKDKVCEKLEIGGLRPVLDARSWADAWSKTVATLRYGTNNVLDQATQHAWGISFHDARSARAAVRQRVKQEVDKQVGRLLLKVTTNEVVVGFASYMICDWIKTNLWPHVREFFRQKGRLDERTARSLQTLEEARQRLWRLAPDAHIRDVKSEINNANGTIYATRYLAGDIDAAHRTDLAKKLRDARSNLNLAAAITSARYLLNKRTAVNELSGEPAILAGLINTLDRLRAHIKTPIVQSTYRPPVTVKPKPPTSKRPALIRFSKPLYLIHIIQTATMSGPVKKDAWILFSIRPDGRGVVLTPDGSGGNFINNTDRCLGPYGSNWEVGPALVANHIKGVSLGNGWIDGNPDLWK